MLFVVKFDDKVLITLAVFSLQYWMGWDLKNIKCFVIVLSEFQRFFGGSPAVKKVLNPTELCRQFSK